jgi:hypothetical protein
MSTTPAPTPAPSAEQTPGTGIDLDLGALAGARIKIQDASGRVWTASDALPLRTMLTLYRLAQDGEREQMTIDDVESVIDAVHAIFSFCDRSVTRDDVVDSFTLDDMLVIISRLSSTGAEPASATAHPTRSARKRSTQTPQP